ncbi:MAG: hypothetical protein IT159_02760 [Bryobacterales bacterium]|nr:hypothetical protein [Bryobacterales bacterium]
MLLETVTADGTISESEVNELRAWLDQNCDADLPAIEMLRTMLGQILADGKVTPEERKALHKAVERVLPPELREKARGQRVASELLEKAHAREEKAAKRAQDLEKRERNRPIYSANFMVAGVTYEGRARIVDSYLKPGEAVFLARDPGNQFDPNAIEIRLPQGYVIGYVPREYASEMAPLLDGGCKQLAYCTKILAGQRAPIPVVQSGLYQLGSSVPGKTDDSGVPPRQGAPKARSTGCSACLLLIFGLVVLVSLFFYSVLKESH